MSWTPEEIARIEAAAERWTIGKQRSGSWHELLANRKVVDDSATQSGSAMRSDKPVKPDGKD